MKLKTSFFKSVTLKKDILRFAPIWALYLIGMMMVLLDMGYYQDYDRYARNMMEGLVKSFGIVNICYAGISANLLFGDLYNTKLCYSLHAMPYRRESWLVTHLASGLLFSLVPNTVACLYMMFRLENYWFIALYWLLAVTLQFIFFYGIATVSALLTGNRFAMLAVYAGFNFVSMLLYATVEVIYIPMLTGVSAYMGAFSRFSPVVYLFQFDYFQFTRKEVVSVDVNKPAYDNSDYFYQFDGLTDGWGYMAILAAVGIVAMAVAVWLYRKRNLESAGDFVAFPRLKGISCVIITMCVALCFALLGAAMGSGYVIWLAVGLIVGFFGSLMLLERRLKVFRKKTWLGFGALALAVTLSVLAIHCDWFGIESWTPKAEKVQSVTVTNRSPSSYYYDDLYGDAMTVTLEDEADIAQIIAAHEDILTRLDDEYSSMYRVTLTYKMKSGRTVVRSYYVPATGEGYQTVRRYLYNTDSVLGFTDVQEAAANVVYMYSNKGQVPAALYEKVLTALQADCDDGYVLPNGNGEYYVEYAIEMPSGENIYRSLAVLKYAEQIPALMKGPEIAMGYTDWEAFLGQIQHMYLEEFGDVPKDQWKDLLTAIRKDLEAGTIPLDRYVSGCPLVCYEFEDTNGEWGFREFCITEEAKYTNLWLSQYWDE